MRGDKTIELLNDWAAPNIVSVHIPCLEGVDVGGGKRFSGNVQWYKGAVYQLKGAFAEVEAKGLKPKILTYAGSFYPRLIRGASHTPSEHTFGTAFDINVAWNGLNHTPAPKGTRGSVYELVPIFEKWGFRWGGNFKREDGMHFEVARILKPEGGTTVASKTIAKPADPMTVYINNKLVEGCELTPDGLRGPVRATLEAAGLTVTVVKEGNDYLLKAFKV